MSEWEKQADNLKKEADELLEKLQLVPIIAIIY